MSDDKGKFVSLHGGGEPDKFAEAVRNLRKGLATHLEYVALDAQIKRAHYLALIKEGFTEHQALTIVKEK